MSYTPFQMPGAPRPNLAPPPPAPCQFDANEYVELCRANLERAERTARAEEERKAAEAARIENEKAKDAIRVEIDQDQAYLRTLQILVQDIRMALGVNSAPIRSEYVQHWEQQDMHNWAAHYGYEIVKVGDGTCATLVKQGV